MTNPAPSDEAILHCDIPGCEAQLSMVNGVPRFEHGWGRSTVYEGAQNVKDYDLCPTHFKALSAVLAG